MTTCVAHQAIRETSVDSYEPGYSAELGCSTERVVTAVLSVRACPKRLRASIERAMATCIRTESEFVVPGDDPLFAQWHTRWWKDRGVAGTATGSAVGTPSGVFVGCRQVITGTPPEIDNLRVVVETLAAEFGFSASVERA